MLSALSASDPFAENPFSAFAGGFTPGDCPDLKPTNPNPKPVTWSSGYKDPTQTHVEEKPFQDDPTHVASIMDERKRRRMISNRESARRSRMRKQRHVENLRNQVNMCKIENRELNNRLRFILHLCNRLQTENDWLRSERTLLRDKLSNLTQILVLQQLQPFTSAWPCNTTSTTVTAE